MSFILVWLSAMGLAFLQPADPQYKVVKTPAGKQDLLSADLSAWAKAHSITWGPEAYRTEFRALWDADGLYVRFDAADPNPWHTMNEHDDHLWEEEVVEIFLDPSRTGRNYAEVELNPDNVVCDVRMISGEPNKQMDLSWDMKSRRRTVTWFSPHGLLRRKIASTSLKLSVILCFNLPTKNGSQSRKKLRRYRALLF